MLWVRGDGQSGHPDLWSSCISTQLDGISHYLPFQAAGGKIVVFRQGRYAMLRTSFGLTVSYNWDTHVTAKVPSNYAKAVCGLCGNFNGDPHDDLGIQSMGEALDPRDFGRKWLVTAKPGCRTDEQLVCPDINSKLVVQNKEKCQVLRDKDGPFRDCREVGSFSNAFIECVYDSCRMRGQIKPLCDTLSTYTAICQAEGVTVYPWRSETLCREYQEWRARGWIWCLLINIQVASLNPYDAW